MYIFPNEHNYSRAAMTDCTDYKANNVMTSTREVVDDLTENGIKMINVVSHSLSSQCRKRKMVWLVPCCWKEKTIDLEWIYLENGHGKKIPNGIGATVKKGIKDLVLYNPDHRIYSV